VVDEDGEEVQELVMGNRRPSTAVLAGVLHLVGGNLGVCVFVGVFNHVLDELVCKEQRKKGRLRVVDIEDFWSLVHEGVMLLVVNELEWWIPFIVLNEKVVHCIIILDHTVIFHVHIDSICSRPRVLRGR